MNPRQKNSGEDGTQGETSLTAGKAGGAGLILMICAGLVMVTLAVFAQTARFDFCDYDDNAYVYENASVIRGLTVPGTVAAFDVHSSDNWVPLTTLSHMLDCQLYGLHAGGHHLTNVLLHTAAAILLFFVLREMTGTLWRSALVATVFAIHPSHVESVAWVAERKDVLSGLFFMLTVGVYIRYTRRARSAGAYAMVLLIFALGLMSKPMLVTLPLVLLLLDYWPLNRFAPGQAGGRETGWNRLPVPLQLLGEKVPLLVLAAVSCLLTVQAQSGTLQSVATIPLTQRAGNALVSYATYLAEMFHPVRLAVFYPFAVHGPSAREILLAFTALTGISAWVFVERGKRPYLLTGWLWYLVMLVPVIGLVQAGRQARADRYTYLPEIGLYVMVAWGFAEVSAGWRHRRLAAGFLATIVLGVLMWLARSQASCWANNETLWKHTLACTTNNFCAHYNLGCALLDAGRLDEAIEQYQETLEVLPDTYASPSDYSGTRYNLGCALMKAGRLDEAVEQFKETLAILPDIHASSNDYANAHINLGNTLMDEERMAEATRQFKEALAVKPDDAAAENDLGIALLRSGQLEEAIGPFERAVAIQPDDAGAQNNLGDALLQEGRVEEAAAHYQKALAIRPDFGAAQKGLGHAALILATSPNSSLRNGAKAVKLAQEAVQLSGGVDPMLVATLAAAYAGAGRFMEATSTAEQAVKLARSQNNATLAAVLEEQLKLYRGGSH